VVDSLENIPGLTGLFIAGILSGSLSTVSSAINSLAAVSWEDYISPLIKSKTPLSSTTVSFCNKLLAMLFGAICIGIAFVAENFTGVLQASLTIFGVVGGPLLGLFTLGMMFPFTSQKGAVPAFLLALGIGLWIGFGGPKPPVHRLTGSTLCPYANETSYPVANCASSTPSTK
jgi:sodium-coupled monocarboxylate transporter 8/12